MMGLSILLVYVASCVHTRIDQSLDLAFATEVQGGTNYARYLQGMYRQWLAEEQPRFQTVLVVCPIGM
jgi:hypothetical protein